MPAFSLTYGKRKANMPPLWHTSMSEFLDSVSPRFINSRERGAKEELLHGQAVARLPINATDATIKKVVKRMKEALGVTHGDGAGCTITLKELVVGQTFIRMVGYVLKDEGLPHFEKFVKGVTEEEMERGIAEHVSLKLNYMDGRIAINKTNLFQRTHTFWTNQMTADESLDFSEVVAAMLNSKKYMISSTLIMNSQGQMRSSAASTYWEIIKGQTATKWDVRNILYLPDTTYNRGYHGGLNPPDKTPTRQVCHFLTVFWVVLRIRPICLIICVAAHFAGSQVLGRI